MATEPRLLHCTLRVTSDEFYIPVECRFADGQKFAAVLVDDAFPQLAADIANWLNERARVNA